MQWLLVVAAVVTLAIGSYLSVGLDWRLRPTQTAALSASAPLPLQVGFSNVVLAGEYLDCLVLDIRDFDGLAENVAAIGLGADDAAPLVPRDVATCATAEPFPYPYAVHPYGHLVAVAREGRVIVANIRDLSHFLEIRIHHDVAAMVLSTLPRALLTLVTGARREEVSTTSQTENAAAAHVYDLPPLDSQLGEVSLTPASTELVVAPSPGSPLRRAGARIAWQAENGDFVLVDMGSGAPDVSYIPARERFAYPLVQPFFPKYWGGVVVADGRDLVRLSPYGITTDATLPGASKFVGHAHSHYYAGGEFGVLRIAEDDPVAPESLHEGSVDSMAVDDGGLAYTASGELYLRKADFDWGIDRFTALVTGGLTLGLALLTVLLRRIVGLTAELREARSSISRISATEGVEKLVVAKEEDAKQQLDRNRRREYSIASLEVEQFLGFAQLRWDLSPGVNVLLGKNGYGKSLLFRTAVGLLWNDWQSLLKTTRQAGAASIRLDVLADGELHTIESMSSALSSRIGRLPVLAIPDARFIDRSRDTVAPPADKYADLVRMGAEVFLNGDPFDPVINSFLFDLSRSYSKLRGGFRRAPFPLLESVVAGLTEDEFRFHSVTEHSGGALFTIKVVAGSVSPEPVPIQVASQGTLSILSIFGLIYRFLRTVWEDESDAVCARPAVVLIDELDAHLHPSWQQKIVGLLRRTFPNVQFIISAHSPLIAAGCLRGEVAVLRRRENSYEIEEINQDLIGARSLELYRLLFEVDDVDEALQYYSFQQDRGVELDERIQSLRKAGESGDLTSQAELDRLTRERELLQRAGEAREQQQREHDEVARLKAQIRELTLKLEDRET